MADPGAELAEISAQTGRNGTLHSSGTEGHDCTGDGVGATSDQADCRSSTRAGLSREHGDPRGHFASAGSKIIMQQKVVTRFQDLENLAGKAYIDPVNLHQVAVIGAGSFAKVTHCKLRRGGKELDCAVKLLKPELFSDINEVVMFIKEGATLQRIHHPNVVRVLGLGFKPSSDGTDVTPENMFICQELCQGGSLRSLVLKQMCAPSKVVYSFGQGLQWCLQVARGLQCLHTSDPRIVHRDLKLENILLEGQPGAYTAKLADFGLHATIGARAQRLEATISMQSSRTSSLASRKSGKDLDYNFVSFSANRAVAPGLEASTSMNNASHLLTKWSLDELQLQPKFDLTSQTGSYFSMAPEVLLAQPYNEKADIFSLGVMMYEVFSKCITAVVILHTGRPDEALNYAFTVADGYRPPIPKAWAKPLRQLLSSCWEQDPDDRPSATQVASSLHALADSGDVVDNGPPSGGSSCCCCIQ